LHGPTFILAMAGTYTLPRGFGNPDSPDLTPTYSGTPSASTSRSMGSTANLGAGTDICAGSALLVPPRPPCPGIQADPAPLGTVTAVLEPFRGGLIEVLWIDDRQREISLIRCRRFGNFIDHDERNVSPDSRGPELT
jgi:hypothetical protein